MTDNLKECFDEMKISMRDLKKVIDQAKVGRQTNKERRWMTVTREAKKIKEKRR
jgi:hypothetical protein